MYGRDGAVRGVVETGVVFVVGRCGFLCCRSCFTAGWRPGRARDRDSTAQSFFFSDETQGNCRRSVPHFPHPQNFKRKMSAGDEPKHNLTAEQEAAAREKFTAADKDGSGSVCQ